SGRRERGEERRVVRRCSETWPLQRTIMAQVPCLASLRSLRPLPSVLSLLSRQALAAVAGAGPLGIKAAVEKVEELLGRDAVGRPALGAVALRAAAPRPPGAGAPVHRADKHFLDQPSALRRDALAGLGVILEGEEPPPVHVRRLAAREA